MSLDTDTPLLIQQDLYFGNKTPYGKKVSQQEFQAFVDNVITPRFPAGLTVFDANGEILKNRNRLSKNNINVVSLFVEDSSASEAAINDIVEAYNQQFPRAPVLQVTNKDDLKVCFGVGEDLIDFESVLF